MSRDNRPEHLLTPQGKSNPIETKEEFWQMRASKNGTSYIVHVGYARPNTATSTAGWLISKSTYDTSGNLVIRQHAADSTGRADFNQIWDASAAFTITAITKAANAEVTTSAAHGYSTNDVVEIIDSDMTEVNSDGYGSIVFTITKVNATKFTLGVNSSAYVAAGTSGSVYKRDYLNLTYA